MPAQTLIELLETAAGSGDEAVVRFAESDTASGLGDLLVAGRRASTVLRAHGVGPDEPVGLMVKNGPGFLTGLFGVLCAGAVVVPLPLLFTADVDAYVDHIRRIVADAGMRVMVIDATLLSRVRNLLAAAMPDVRFVATDVLTASGPDEPGATVSRGPDDLAVVQYTSGSTAQPKGVALTNRNVLAGLAAIRTTTALSSRDRWSLWLPLFHDMGLFSLMSALTTGGDVLLYQPRTFMRRPADWLRRFAAERRTITVAPNFAYELLNAVRTEVRDDGLDLSAWRLAFNGAEPVQWQTVELFQRTYGPCGFRASVMYPVYGMAEATLAVTFPVLGTEPRSFRADRAALAGGGPAGDGVAVEAAADDPAARQVMCVGSAVPGVRLRIRAGGRPAPPGTVGEVEIGGDPVTRGYYRRPAGTGLSADGWLPTGDLGFLLDDQLYIVGRTKNVLIVHGRNHFAEDVESMVRVIPGVFQGRCAALASHDADGEHMGVVIETELRDEADLDRLRRATRERLQSALGLAAVRISFVAPRSIPYTSSGKVRRGGLRLDRQKSPA